MRDTIVEMKDGRKFCGPMWSFRPVEGYITLVGVVEPLYFRDMASCITKNERVGQGIVRDVDEIKRARKLGWKE